MRVARLHVLRETRISRRRALRGAHHRFGRDGERGAGLEHRVAVFEASQPDLGTLQIEQNAGVHARITRRAAHRVDARRVLVLRAVRRIQAENIHARGKQLAQDAGRIGGRPQRGYDFGIGHPVELS